ncbi:hypothetical protein [Bacillus andreraoultii]|nr:hypothetical protein [Bacillus andreraoultii]
MKKLLIVTIFTLFCIIHFETDFQVATDVDVGPMNDYPSEIGKI